MSEVSSSGPLLPTSDSLSSVEHDDTLLHSMQLSFNGLLTVEISRSLISAKTDGDVLPCQEETTIMT